MTANDPGLTSFVAVRPESHFPIQNLPYGAFSRDGDARRRLGVAIGDAILDLSVVERVGLLPAGEPLFDGPALNAFLARGPAVWSAVRRRVSELLRADNPELRDDASLRARALVPQSQATMHVPHVVPSYTDFFSSREHATNAGRIFRGDDDALLPNWLELPVAYNGRASSVVVSGTPVRRPLGQTKSKDAARPALRPCAKLDFELEMAFVVGPGNALGEPIAVADAERHVFGLVLLNDWSARDVQQWEAVPLGPFNSKSFATSISPWIVTLEALEPFRVAGPRQEPVPLPYLQQGGEHAFDIALEVRLNAGGGRPETTLCRSNARFLYWSIAQQLAHHTISGCSTAPGDLMASGTISGTAPDARGCLLERTWDGRDPVVLEDGTTRTYLHDGDEIVMSGVCSAATYRIGFGDVRGRIVAALPSAPGDA